MLDFKLCESRKTVLGPWASRSPSMELTAPHRESGGTLAQGPATGPGLAPNTLPVWAVKPWFGISFHCAQLSSVYGVLLYPILDGLARHAWLGPRTTAQAKPSITDWAQATLKAETWVGALLSDGTLVLGSRSTGLVKMVQEPRARLYVVEWRVVCH